MRDEVVTLEGAPRLLGGRGSLGFFGALRLWSGRALFRIWFVDNRDAEIDAVLVLHFLRGFKDGAVPRIPELVAGLAGRPFLEITNKFDAGLARLPDALPCALT